MCNKVDYGHGLDLDTVDKHKRLFLKFSREVGPIFYTMTAQSRLTLFETAYKGEKYRPKVRIQNSKLWDSLPSKTICIDQCLTQNLQLITRLHFPKNIKLFIYEIRQTQQKAHVIIVNEQKGPTVRREGTEKEVPNSSTIQSRA